MPRRFDLDDDTLVVIIGSGAGGGTLGNELALRDYNLGMAMIKWHRYLSTLPSYKCVPDPSPTNPQLKALDKELQRIVAERPWTENTAMELGAANRSHINLGEHKPKSPANTTNPSWAN
jgi:hypothetical protein